MSTDNREFEGSQMLHMASGSPNTVPLRSSMENNLSYGSVNDDSAHYIADDDTTGLLRRLSTNDVRNVPADALSRWSQGPQLAVANQSDSRRTLGMFSGVFSPVALSMFSALLFLRIGFVLGQAGLIETLVQFMLAYFILYLTILSICAISTNGAIEGGGAYFMISRALGPEFGGAIGILFFCAQAVACAMYISGFVEALVDNFGQDGGLVSEGTGLPTGAVTGEVRWWNYLYSTLVCAMCLVVSLVGGAMFGKTSVFIFLIMIVCMVSVLISFLVKSGMCIEYPNSNKIHPQPPVNDTSWHDPVYPNCTNYTATYTGLSSDTLAGNIYDRYMEDYLTGRKMSFAAVFSVLFSSVTGIMNGANMSGDLKQPSRSIPKGTLAATTFTLMMYLFETLLIAATAERDLLTGNYNFLSSVNVWPPFVVIGLFAATLSAAMANLIGGSRILHAVAKDEIYWILLKPATVTTKSGNPVVSVLITWLLVQLVLLIGSMNAIAPMCSEMFLLSYASTNLACLALDLSSAPNFRPTFRYFSAHTALLGMLGSLAMCFLIDAVYATIAIAVLILLVVVLHVRSLETSWGSISQALIFHQVRKYLLLLDSRKNHIKFWRPQMLLMVANPRTSCHLIDFVNDLKKTGLYVVGHVHVGTMDDSSDSPDPAQLEHPNWLELIDFLKVKAFVELTVSDSVRDGMRHLVRVSGLGGMKPNTVCLGFYDNSTREDLLANYHAVSSRNWLLKLQQQDSSSLEESGTSEICYNFPDPKQSPTVKEFNGPEYVGMICDALRMNQNVCLFRHFAQFNKHALLSRRRPASIDVWPVNFFGSSSVTQFDTTCLFLLQLACILHMVPGWKRHSSLRIFACVPLGTSLDETQLKKRRLEEYLSALRISGKVHVVAWENVETPKPSRLDSPNFSGNALPEEDHVKRINGVIREQCSSTAVVFLYLPRPPSDFTEHEEYLRCLEMMTDSLPPAILVHGLHPVTSTTL